MTDPLTAEEVAEIRELAKDRYSHIPGHPTLVLCDTIDHLRDDRDHWKANHDAQVEVKRRLHDKYDQLLRQVSDGREANPEAMDASGPPEGEADELSTGRPDSGEASRSRPLGKVLWRGKTHNQSDLREPGSSLEVWLHDVPRGSEVAVVLTGGAESE